MDRYIRVSCGMWIAVALSVSACDMYIGAPEDAPEQAETMPDSMGPSAEALFERPVRTGFVVTAQQGQSLDWLSLVRNPVRAEVLVVDPRFAMSGGLYYLDEGREIKSVVLDGTAVTYTVVAADAEPEDEDGSAGHPMRGQWVDIKLFQNSPEAVDERGLEGPDRFRLVVPVRDNGRMYVVEVPVQQVGRTWYLPSAVVGTLTGRGSIVNQRSELIASVVPDAGVLRNVVPSPYEEPATDTAR